MTAAKAALPKTVKVGAVRYAVTREPTAHLAAEAEMSNRLAGFSDHSNLRIIVNPTLADDVAKQTVVHEIVHCVFSSIHGYSFEDEERICLSLESGLLQVLRDNPKLVTWLQS